ncbi:hypothetical protein EVG20_g7475 [Dentipellis fragilis]|uniref:Uncharacterized protein n=1 Tax=Dentipellis fragilis TaxID=205917 RepID=A0A4Y9YD46_9AGAM|nr:hypothetical protein EVG20_g7475 [Dentipellis fragilis]
MERMPRAPTGTGTDTGICQSKVKLWIHLHDIRVPICTFPVLYMPTANVRPHWQLLVNDTHYHRHYPGPHHELGRGPSLLSGPCTDTEIESPTQPTGPGPGQGHPARTNHQLQTAACNTQHASTSTQHGSDLMAKRARARAGSAGTGQYECFQAIRSMMLTLRQRGEYCKALSMLVYFGVNVTVGPTWTRTRRTWDPEGRIRIRRSSRGGSDTCHYSNWPRTLLAVDVGPVPRICDLQLSVSVSVSKRRLEGEGCHDATTSTPRFCSARRDIDIGVALDPRSSIFHSIPAYMLLYMYNHYMIATLSINIRTTLEAIRPAPPSQFPSPMNPSSSRLSPSVHFPLEPRSPLCPDPPTLTAIVTRSPAVRDTTIPPSVLVAGAAQEARMPSSPSPSPSPSPFPPVFQPSHRRPRHCATVAAPSLRVLRGLDVLE